MENQNQQTEVFSLQFDETAKYNLRTMARWSIIIVITVVAGYLVGIIDYFQTKNRVSVQPEFNEDTGTGNFSVVLDSGNIVMLLLPILVGLLLCYFLYRFSVKSKNGVENMDLGELNQGLVSLKNYFMALGILSIIVIVLVFIILLFAGTFM